MFDKRITLFCGHYGSGKTNIAVNAALKLSEEYKNIALADLDIVNPYFRTKDSSSMLSEKGIRLICSEYANSNVDIPALPAEIYAITDDKNLKSVVDIGGDDRGAYVLGRISEKIVSENDYDMLMVINSYRPLTRDAQSTMEVLNEIETAAKIKFTGLINNSNLGEETTPEDVLASLEYAQSVSKATGLPIVATTVKEELYEALLGKIENLFPLKLQEKIM
ncbi:MAG: MinD/ParA family protein [Ruminococcaceae bacterium]|nr:MinD/ParA family protein [Oscillospiraceae bacterium]